MPRPLSLAQRLTLLFGIAAAIVFPLFGWIILHTTEHHFASEDADELRTIARAVEETLRDQRVPGDRDYLEQRLGDILVGHHNASLSITDVRGKTLYSSPGPAVPAAATRKDGGTRSITPWRDADHTYATLTQPVQGNDQIYNLTITVPNKVHQRFLTAFRQTLWIMIVTCIAIVSLLGWVAVRQGHAPLHDIVNRIRRISASELNTRLPPENMPAELTDLAVSFNDMLQRVDAAFHRLADFNADIAHELRTPITNLMTQTQVALSRTRSPEEYREILYSNMEEYERMAQMVNDMLFLAQTDNRQQPENIETLHLEREIRAVFDYYEGWAEECDITLILRGRATVEGNQSMLRRALGNLISNAIRHTPAGGEVHISLEIRDDHAEITVENPGPMIPPEHLPKLFDRFYRVDPSRQRGSDGAGLGLAIVKSIVIAHSGEVSVASSQGKTRFRISLPRFQKAASKPISR